MEIVYTEDNIAEVAKQLLEKAPHNIFLFFAKMGVGKTTLIKELIKQEPQLLKDLKLDDIELGEVKKS